MRVMNLTHFAVHLNIFVNDVTFGLFSNLAPEMIVGSGHDHSLDWWALGILM